MWTWPCEAMGFNIATSLRRSEARPTVNEQVVNMFGLHSSDRLEDQNKWKKESQSTLD